MILDFAHRTIRTPAFWVAGILLIAGIASNLGADESPLSLAQEQSKPTPERVTREGTRIESRLAECRSEGERLAILFPESNRTLIALENLATQRILKAILDDPHDKHWVVTGSLTEFQGRNYLLIERVSRVAKS